MRKVEFRAWNTNDKYMEFFENGKCGLLYRYGELIVSSGYDGEDNPTFDYDSRVKYEIMQYTGLKDKNGVKIFEGDFLTVLMIFKGGTLPHMGAIVYSNNDGSFVTKNESGITLLHNHLLVTAEVIGNIHENPELLEAEK